MGNLEREKKKNTSLQSVNLNSKGMEAKPLQDSTWILNKWRL